MKLEFKEYESTIFKKEFKILQPTEELLNLYACRDQAGYQTIYGDIGDLSKLGFMFAYACSRRDVIIYVPLRQHGLTNYLKSREGEHSARDIVILHHSLQFNYKNWKAIRQSIRTAKYQLVVANMADTIFAEVDVKDFRSYNYKENKDTLHIRDYLETFFFVGSSPIFGSIAGDCKSLADAKPDEFYQEHPGYHDHKHLDAYVKKNINVSFSIDFYDEKLWGD